MPPDHTRRSLWSSWPWEVLSSAWHLHWHRSWEWRNIYCASLLLAWRRTIFHWNTKWFSQGWPPGSHYTTETSRASGTPGPSRIIFTLLREPSHVPEQLKGANWAALTWTSFGTSGIEVVRMPWILANLFTRSYCTSASSLTGKHDYTDLRYQKFHFKFLCDTKFTFNRKLLLQTYDPDLFTHLSLLQPLVSPSAKDIDSEMMGATGVRLAFFTNNILAKMTFLWAFPGSSWSISWHPDVLGVVQGFLLCYCEHAAVTKSFNMIRSPCTSMSDNVNLSERRETCAFCVATSQRSRGVRGQHSTHLLQNPQTIPWSRVLKKWSQLKSWTINMLLHSCCLLPFAYSSSQASLRWWATMLVLTWHQMWTHLWGRFFKILLNKSQESLKNNDTSCRRPEQKFVGRFPTTLNTNTYCLRMEVVQLLVCS